MTKDKDPEKFELHIFYFFNFVNYAAAAARIERALRINPEDASAWHKLAQLQFNQKIQVLFSKCMLKDDLQMLGANRNTWSPTD